MPYYNFHKYYKYGWLFALLIIIIGLILWLIELAFNVKIIQ